MSIFDSYTDGEPIGMNHPLFMMRMQSRIDAGMLFDQGLPLVDAVRQTRARMQELFGGVPQALVDTTVYVVYAERRAMTVVVNDSLPAAVQLPEAGPVVAPYRYARDMVVVRCESPDGFKSRAARLAEHVGGRWVHRAGGYVMSPRKAERLNALFQAGRDASTFTGNLLDPAVPGSGS